MDASIALDLPARGARCLRMELELCHTSVESLPVSADYGADIAHTLAVF